MRSLIVSTLFYVAITGGSASAQAPAAAPAPATAPTAASPQASGSAASTGYQPFGTMSQLMIDILYPTSDSIFYAGRNPNKTDADWNVLKNNAMILAESGNLLMMPGRARDQGEWMKDAKLLVDAGAAAYKAAQAKDLEAMLALNDQLYAACVLCHQTYRPSYGRRRLPQPAADPAKK